MPVNITGAKYAIRSISAVGTTSVTIATGTFVIGDFGATQRMVQLHSSTGALKGIAMVRRFVSSTNLELENQFVDPATGLYATQVVGDQVLVSKNSAESAVAGFAVDTVAMTVTVTDNVLMGTAGSQTSLCFYDQNMTFIITNGFTFNGGVSVFGKLIAYDGTGLDSFVWSRECNVRPRTNYNGTGGTPAYNFWGTGGTSAHMFFFGGAIGNSLRDSFFIGAQTTNATNGSYCFYGTRIYYACASPSNGGNWSANASRHLLYKTIHEADYTNANLIVWGNGAFKGQYLSFPQFGAGNPIGVFRASSAVTFGADANNRTVVADVGNGAFIDDANNGSYTFINTITPAVSILRFAGGTVPITFQFSDSYTNLKLRSTLVMQRGDGTVLNSVVNTANTIYTPVVTQAIYSATANGNATPVNFYQTFNYTVKCYGYDVVSGSHTPYTYSLGTAGNGTDLKIGGLINQLVDDNVTLSETNALLLSSKFSINSTTKVITVTANATYDELYDYVIAWNCSSQANALIPNLSQYLITANGTDLTAYTGWSLVVSTGVTLSLGAKFSKVKFTGVTINGTGKITGVYSNDVSTSETVTGTYQSNIIQVADKTNWRVGSRVSSAFGIPSGTVVLSFGSGNNVELSNNYTGTTGSFDVSVTTERTSTVLTISGFGANSAVYVEDNNGVEKYFNTDVTGSIVIYIPPTASGSWYYAIEKFGNQRQSDFFTFSGGQKAIVAKDLPDNKILLTKSQIIALPSVDNGDEAYDAIALLRTQTPYISFGQIVSKDGSTLYGYDYDIVIDANAVKVAEVDYDDKLITLKSALFEAGPVCNLVKVDVPKTVTANTTESITVNIEDANGDSTVTIEGVVGNLVDVWKCVNGTINDDYQTGTKIASNIGAGKFRFIGESGYKLIFYDKNFTLARDCSMLKGTYLLGWYVFNSPNGGLDQAQSAKFESMYSKIDVVDDNVVSIKDTVENLSAGSGATIAEIEASTVLAKEATVEAVKAKTDVLENYDDAVLTGKVDAIKSVVDNLENYDDSVLIGKVDSIKEKTDILENTNLTGIATTNDVGQAVESINYEVGKANNTIGEVKAKTDILDNYNDTTLIAKVDAVKAVVDNLENYDDAVLTGKVDSVKAVVDTIENYDDTVTQTKLDSIQQTVNDIDVDFTPVLDALAEKPTLAQIKDSTELSNEPVLQKLNQMDEGLKAISNFEPYE